MNEDKYSILKVLEESNEEEVTEDEE